MTLAPGTRLGPYEIAGQLGTGGMGEVWKARDPKLDRFVAIKVLPSDFAADGDRLKRFQQEAKALAALNHPNLVQVFESGEHEGAPYLVMELLEGETLREKLGGRPLPARRSADLALQVARGLAAAHQKGILHRDLKPENLWITKEGRLKLLDFGLAKLQPGKIGSESATRAFLSEPGTLVGTSGYMSPEQVQGEALDARSDLFNLGVVLWEMLTGKGPFHRDSAVETMHAILKEEPPELDPSLKVPPGLLRILDHCLAKDASARFHSATDLAFALEGLSGSGSGAATGPLRAGPWRRGRAAVLVLSGAAVVLAWLGAAHALRWPPFQERPQPTFQRLSFRRGNITVARFAPDGRSILCSATWDGRPADLYQLIVGSPESRALGLPGADLLAVSPKGELAFSLRDATGQRPNVLARMPMLGGTAREILENVGVADWGPNAEDLAVVRFGDEKTRLEYPIGSRLCDLPNGARWLRVSPSGRAVAWFEYPPNSRLMMADRNGATKALGLDLGSVSGLAWSADGRRLYVSGGRTEYEQGLWEVPLDGPPRMLLRGPKSLILHDADPRGRLLVELSSWREETMAQNGDAPLRDITWLDDCDEQALSPDGETVLYHDKGELSGPDGTLWIRKKGARDPVRLTEGIPLGGLSPDGKWVALGRLGRPEVTLFPTGTGTSRILPLPALVPLRAHWFPDGRRMLFLAEQGSESRSWHVLDLDTGRTSPFQGLDNGRGDAAFSSDGKQVVYARTDGTIGLQPGTGGPVQVLAFRLGRRELILQWSQDGKSLFLVDTGRIPGRIDRLDLATGARIAWKDLPIHPVEGYHIYGMAISRDGQSWACSYRRVLSCDLYQVEGLQ